MGFEEIEGLQGQDAGLFVAFLYCFKEISYCLGVYGGYGYLVIYQFGHNAGCNGSNRRLSIFLLLPILELKFDPIVIKDSNPMLAKLEGNQINVKFGQLSHTLLQDENKHISNTFTIVQFVQFLY